MAPFNEPCGRLAQRARPRSLRPRAGSQLRGLRFPAGLLLARPSSRDEGRARLAARSSIPLRGRDGDDAYGLRDRPDTEDRTPQPARPHPRRGLRDLRSRLPDSPILAVAKIRGVSSLAGPRSLHPGHGDNGCVVAAGRGVLSVRRHAARLDRGHRDTLVAFLLTLGGWPGRHYGMESVEATNRAGQSWTETLRHHSESGDARFGP